MRKSRWLNITFEEFQRNIEDLKAGGLTARGAYGYVAKVIGIKGAVKVCSEGLRQGDEARLQQDLYALLRTRFERVIHSEAGCKLVARRGRYYVVYPKYLPFSDPEDAIDLYVLKTGADVPAIYQALSDASLPARRRRSPLPTTCTPGGPEITPKV